MKDTPKNLEWLEFPEVAVWSDEEQAAAVEAWQALFGLEPRKTRVLLTLFAQQLGERPAPRVRVGGMCGIGVNPRKPRGPRLLPE